MYGLIGRIIAHPGQRDALAAILLEGVAGMPGCRSYVVSEDPGHPDALWVTEVWVDAEHHRASLALPSVQAAIARGRPLIAGFDSRQETRPLGGHGGLMPSAPTPRHDASRNVVVRGGDTGWIPLPEPGVTGIDVRPLRADPAAGRAPTFLLRFAPGATYPLHTHPAGEELYVLEGDLRLGKDHLHAGDYLYTAPGNVHAVKSDRGCLALFVVPEEVVWLDRGALRDPGDGAVPG